MFTGLASKSSLGFVGLRRRVSGDAIDLRVGLFEHVLPGITLRVHVGLAVAGLPLNFTGW